MQDGVIVGKSTAPVLTSTYCLTKRHYTDFRMIIDVKLVESEMHSGISLWGHVPPPQHGEDNTYAGHLVMFPSSKCSRSLCVFFRRSSKKAAAQTGACTTSTRTRTRQART